MKKCLTCGFENALTMSFCMQCGTALQDIAPSPNDYKSIETQSLRGVPTNFGKSNEKETFNFQPNFDTNFQQSAPPPKQKNKLFLIIGGIASLLFLGVAAIGAIVVYNQLLPKPTPIPLKITPSPTASNDGKTTPSPRISPTVSPTPQTSFTPPTEATKRGTFTIYGNGKWQVSDINVVPSEQFRVTTVGLIDIDGVKTQVTAKGITDKKSVSRRLYPEYPTGALLFRTRYPDGHQGNVMPVSGGSFINFPDEIGKLEFCINDNAPESNGGQFTVTVTMTSVPKPKK